MLETTLELITLTLFIMHVEQLARQGNDHFDLWTCWPSLQIRSYLGAEFWLHMCQGIPRVRKVEKESMVIGWKFFLGILLSGVRWTNAIPFLLEDVSYFFTRHSSNCLCQLQEPNPGPEREIRMRWWLGARTHSELLGGSAAVATSSTPYVLQDTCP